MRREKTAKSGAVSWPTSIRPFPGFVSHSGLRQQNGRYLGLRCK
jgi:hypothetical protein